MAEKQTFVQIVDQKTGAVERVADLKEIEALSVEDKLALARNKTLYVVSHKLEPVIRVELRKVNINPVSYTDAPAPEPKAAILPAKAEAAKPKPVVLPPKAETAKPKPAKVEKQAEINIKPTPKGKPKK